MRKYDKNMELLRLKLEDFFSIDLGSTNRKIRHVAARSIYFRICKKMSVRLSHEKIAKTVNRDHATVTHSLKKFDDEYKYNNVFKNYYDSFMREESDFISNILETNVMSRSKVLLNDLNHLLNYSKLTNEQVEELFSKIETLKKEYEQ